VNRGINIDFGQRLTSGYLPDPYSLVIATANNGLSVGTEGDRVDIFLMFVNGFDYFTLRPTPNFNSIVLTGSGESISVRTNGYGCNIFSMLFESVS